MKIEQDIYNRRIVELMKRKTLLIDKLNNLLELTQKAKHEPAKHEQAGIPVNMLLNNDRKD